MEPGRRRGRGGKRARSPRRDSSSDTGNELSAGEDDTYTTCVYTYRGGEPLADLHSSFFSLGVEPPSSPDMDYLEMDFEPSPPGERAGAGSGAEDETPTAPRIAAALLARRALDELEAGPSTRHCNDLDDAPPACSSACDDSPVSNRFPAPVSNGIRHPPDGGSDLEADNSSDPTDDRCLPSTSRGSGWDRVYVPTPTRPVNVTGNRSIVNNLTNGKTFSTLIPHVTIYGEIIYVKRTCLSWPAGDVQSHHSSSGDLVSPGEVCEGDLPESFSWNCAGRISPEQGGMLEASRVNLSSALFHCTMAKKLFVDNHASKFMQEHDTSNVDGESSCGGGELPIVPKCMVWTEQEACSRQVTQIGTSACGATAVINVLLALQQAVDVERVTSSVNTRQRANNASLCRYIISRAIAGCGISSLADGLRTGSQGAVSSRFFATWPERVLPLSHWLAYWIGLGAVPIATLNLQSGIVDPNRIPDSWHHQMIFGVGPRGIYMSNPVECVEEGSLWHQLCSDSVLLIKRKDILSRWTRDTDLRPLMNVPGDERWTTMNVLGQVVNMIRESQLTTFSNGLTRTTHIKIPACYSAGITIAALTGSDAHKKLLEAPELPLYIPDDE